MTYLAHGELVVVEAGDEVWIGTAQVVGDRLVVRPGFRGRPVVLALEDVDRITPAGDHPDVDHA